MHELSIAMSIVDIAEEKAKQSNANKVSEIELEVGNLSGVIYEALEFAMEEAVKNTLLNNAKCSIIKISGKARCNNCENEFGLDDFYAFCPNCNEFDFEIIQGKELRVKSIIIE